MNLASLKPVLQRRSALVLIAANLVPLVGVLFFGWSAFDVVFLFWLENAVIGFFNIAKMLVVGALGNPRQEGGQEVEDDRSAPVRVADLGGMIFLTTFFCFHYGIFMLVHGMFVVLLLKDPAGPRLGEVFDLLPHIKEAIIGQLGLAFLALFLSHGFSFITNFIGRREYERVNGKLLMIAPYGRIVVIHLAILLGGIIALFLPQVMVALLVLLKIGLDLIFHLVERHRGAITWISFAKD